VTPAITGNSPTMLKQKASNALAASRWVNSHPGKVCPTPLRVIKVEN
jgi:hypothetical protein